MFQRSKNDVRTFFKYKNSTDVNICCLSEPTRAGIIFPKIKNAEKLNAEWNLSENYKTENKNSRRLKIPKAKNVEKKFVENKIS